MKKFICATLCLLLMLSLVACGDEVQTKTVSLLVAETRYRDDGSLYGEYTYQYDDRGNLLRAEYPGNIYNSYSYTYDDYGYLTECTRTYEPVPGREGSSTEQYLYTLKNGLPKSCQVISNGKEQYTCHFKTNKKGLITRVDYEYTSDIFSQQFVWRWATFEYDRNGRLLQESFCSSQPLGYPGPSDAPDLIMYSLGQYRYEYNQDGTLKSLDFEYGGSTVRDEEIRDPSEVSFEQQHHWEFVRNDQGQLTQITIDGDPNEFTVTDSGISIPARYSDEWELDQMGNVISTGNDTYVYETVELSVQDADRYDRWNIHLRSSISPTHLTWLRLHCLPIYHSSYEQFFYYYLIPNPLA